MRRLLIAFFVSVGLVGFAPAANAAVPGLSYTETGCEANSDAVARLYTAAFNRVPEAGGFNFWLGLYSSAEWSLPKMAAHFADSDEFKARFGDVDDAGFLTQMYRNVLDRDPDATGLDFWVGQMANGLSRGDLLLRFSESTENVAKSGTSEPPLGPFNAGTNQPFTCDNADVIELCNAYLAYLADTREIVGVAEALGDDAPIGVLAALDVLQDPDADFFDDVLPAQDSLSGYVVPICRTRWDRGLVPVADSADLVTAFFGALVAGAEFGAVELAPDDVRALFEPWEPILDDPELGPPSFSYDGGDSFSMLLGPTITVFCTLGNGSVTSCGFGE